MIRCFCDWHSKSDLGLNHMQEFFLWIQLPCLSATLAVQYTYLPASFIIWMSSIATDADTHSVGDG